MAVQQDYRSITFRESDAVVGAAELTRWMLGVCQSGGLITMCSWCRRIDVDGIWLRPPRNGLSRTEEQFALTFSICPDCVVNL